MKPNFLNSIWHFLMLSAIYACSPNQAKDNEVKEELVVVRTYQVSSQLVTKPITSSGLLASKKEVKLSFKTGGIISAIQVDEGQTVKKGQLLASLNLTEINSQVKGAEQAYQKASRDLERTRQLYADSAATMEQVQNAITGMEVAAASLQATTFNRQYSTIYAPDNGQILKRFAEAGELVSPGAPLFVFASTGKEQWIIRTGISDRDMVRLNIGDKAIVQFDAYPQINFMAAVTEIAQLADPTKGTFEIELQVNPQGKKLASGMVAKLQISPSQTISSLLIPIEALIEADGDKGFVFVLNEDKQTVKKLPVSISGIYENYVGIREGLTADATIITEGTHYLTQQSKVKVLEQSTATAE